MPPTLSALLADRALGLRLLTTSDPRGRLDRPVSWVHVSELADPTPFLDGGELLLTTGLAFPRDPVARQVGDVGDFDGFVRRLTGRGVIGLGFGTGLSHPAVPDGLVDAAERAGMPLIEVPRATPFIAISKAVSSALAAAAYAEVTATDAAQRSLAKAALGASGPEGVVRRLARLLGGRVLLVDGDGTVLHAASALPPVPSGQAQGGREAAGPTGPTGPTSPTALGAELAAEVRRLRERAGPAGPASATFTLDEEHFSVQTLGGGGGRAACLAVGRPARLNRADLTVLSSAAMLLTLTLALTRSGAQRTAQRRLRTGLMRLMLAGEAETARGPAADVWGALPSPPVRVICAVGPPRRLAALADLLDAGPAGEHGGSCFFAELDDRLVMLVPAAPNDAAVPERDADGPGEDTGTLDVERLAEAAGPGLCLGISSPVGFDVLAEGRRQAWLAADRAGRAGAAVQRFTGSSGEGLLGLVDPGDAAAFAEALLAPLVRHDAGGRGDLVRSLHAWLAAHGQWDAAAARLGVHRHTLRNRMRKVEELAGISLDSPGTRAELWLALQLHPS